MKPESQSIEQAAAEWLARRERGLSPAEEREFAQWLEVDPRHAGISREVERSWSRLDRLRGSDVATRLEAELDGLPVRCGEVVRLPPGRSARFHLPPWLSGALAASVTWLLVYFAWWHPAQSSAPYAETATTEIGVVRTLELPDHSVIRLNTDTALEVLFTKAERRVRLGQGEAFFTIAKNPARPFIVSAAGVEVRAVGTEFNVRLHSRALEVIVREGQVRVDDASNGESLLVPPATVASPNEAAPQLLAAGQRVVIPVAAAPKPATTPAPPAALPPSEIARALAWQDRRIVFESTPLSAIAAEFNRYNRRPLVVADSALAARHFGGTFEINDPGTLVELLQTSYDVVVEERASETVLRLRP